MLVKAENRGLWQKQWSVEGSEARSTYTVQSPVAVVGGAARVCVT